MNSGTNLSGFFNFHSYDSYLRPIVRMTPFHNLILTLKLFPVLLVCTICSEVGFLSFVKIILIFYYYLCQLLSFSISSLTSFVSRGDIDISSTDLFFTSIFISIIINILLFLILL